MNLPSLVDFSSAGSRLPLQQHSTAAAAENRKTVADFSAVCLSGRKEGESAIRRSHTGRSDGRMEEQTAGGETLSHLIAARARRLS